MGIRNRPSESLVQEVKTLQRKIGEADRLRLIAERAERDIATDRAAWRQRALIAEAKLASMGAENERH